MDLTQKYLAFYSENNGKYVETEDSANYAQCMDLAFKWCDTLQIPRDTIRHLYAYQVWTLPFDSTRRYFDLIPNGPTNSPTAGDLVVFGQQVGLAGHICIASERSTSKDLISFDQNWGIPKYSKIVTHLNYYGVLGWLHPKSLSLSLPERYDKIKNILYGGDTDQGKIAQAKRVIETP